MVLWEGVPFPELALDRQGKAAGKIKGRDDLDRKGGAAWLSRALSQPKGVKHCGGAGKSCIS